MVIVVFCLLAPTASAHTVLIGAEPAPASQLDRQIKQVTLQFDDPVETKFAQIKADGRARLRVVKISHPGGDQRKIRFDVVDRLEPGRRTVFWRVLAQDGHTASGAYLLTVLAGRASPSKGKPALVPATSHAHIVGWEALVRGISMLALAGAAGGVAFILLVWQPTLRRVTVDWASAEFFERRSKTLMVRSAQVLTAAAFLSLVVAAAQASDRSVLTTSPMRWLEIAGGTHYGQIWLVTAHLSAISALVLSRARQRRRPLLLAGGILGLIAFMPGLAGHARLANPSELFVAIGFLHIAAATIWLGALAYLALLVPRAIELGDPHVATPAMRDLIGRFSGFATLCVVVIVVTGIAQGVPMIRTSEAMLKTDYGLLLLFKTLLVVLVLGLATATRAIVLGALRKRNVTWHIELRGAMLTEFATGAIIISFAAVLAFAPPGFKRTDQSREVSLAGSSSKVPDR